MSPRTLIDEVLRQAPVLRSDDRVVDAVRRVLESELPALPVADERGRYAGIFGEREFMSALYPGYLQQIKGAAFLRGSIDDAIEKRDECRIEPVGRYLNTEHVDIEPDASDTQVAEIFMHHRVLIVPVVAKGEVRGVVTRRDFFRAIAQRFVDHGAAPG
jgi:CBS domain-containing protein